jgi:large subunit ribosomal protein L5
MSRSNLGLKQKYQDEAIPELKKKFGLKNSLAVPRIVKVVVNSGIGRTMVATSQGKARDELLEEIKKDVSLITGQWPIERIARESIASFKVREGMPIGLSVTLRGQRMYDFLDRLVKIVLPRVRDFRGLSMNGFDQGGNLNLGVKEVMVFPELPVTSAKHNFGLQITIVVSSKNKEQSVELFKLLGFPLQKNG